MGCATSHTVEKTEQRITATEQRIAAMQKAMDHMRLQVESQAVVVEDIQTRQLAFTRQFVAQVSEHVSLCADFKTFIEIASEHENQPKEIMKRVEALLESKIRSGVNRELTKVQEQLHNLESSVLTEEPNNQISVLSIASELHHVQKKVLDLEALARLHSKDSESVNITDVSGDSPEGDVDHVQSDDSSHGNASEEALETLFLKSSPKINGSSASTRDFDVAGVLDFALMEPDDAFEAEISSITARVHRHTQKMKSPQTYPPGFVGSASAVHTFSTAMQSRNGQARQEKSELHVPSRRNLQSMVGSKAPAILVNQRYDYGSDSSES
jgi:hypothetical protein